MRMLRISHHESRRSRIFPIVSFLSRGASSETMEGKSGGFERPGASARKGASANEGVSPVVATSCTYALIYCNLRPILLRMNAESSYRGKIKLAGHMMKYEEGKSNQEVRPRAYLRTQHCERGSELNSRGRRLLRRPSAWLLVVLLSTSIIPMKSEHEVYLLRWRGLGWLDTRSGHQ